MTEKVRYKEVFSSAYSHYYYCLKHAKYAPSEKSTLTGFIKLLLRIAGIMLIFYFLVLTLANILSLIKKGHKYKIKDIFFMEKEEYQPSDENSKDITSKMFTSIESKNYIKDFFLKLYRKSLSKHPYSTKIISSTVRIAVYIFIVQAVSWIFVVFWGTFFFL